MDLCPSILIMAEGTPQPDQSPRFNEEVILAPNEFLLNVGHTNDLINNKGKALLSRIVYINDRGDETSQVGIINVDELIQPGENLRYTLLNDPSIKQSFMGSVLKELATEYTHMELNNLSSLDSSIWDKHAELTKRYYQQEIHLAKNLLRFLESPRTKNLNLQQLRVGNTNIVQDMYRLINKIYPEDTNGVRHERNIENEIQQRQPIREIVVQEVQQLDSGYFYFNEGHGYQLSDAIGSSEFVELVQQPHEKQMRFSLESFKDLQADQQKKVLDFIIQEFGRNTTLQSIAGRRPDETITMNYQLQSHNAINAWELLNSDPGIGSQIYAKGRTYRDRIQKYIEIFTKEIDGQPQTKSLQTFIDENQYWINSNR